MSNNGIRGQNTDPTDTSTVRPKGQRRDPAADEEAASGKRDEIGAGSTQSEYSPSIDYKARNQITREQAFAVYEFLSEYVDGELTYICGATIAEEVGLSRSSLAGKALRALSEDPACPLDIERWSAENTPRAKWAVQPRGEQR